MASRLSTRLSARFARPTALLAVGCLATLLSVGCSDPANDQQVKFERELDAVAAEYGKAISTRPDLLSSRPSDESIAALRAVAGKARGLSGGTTAQDAAARALALSISRTSATLSISRATAIEAEHDVVRAVAIASDAVADDLDALASAAESMDLSAPRTAAQREGAAASSSAKAFGEAAQAVAKPLEQATARVSELASRLSALEQQDAVLLRSARESTPIEALKFVEQAATVQSDARAVRASLSTEQIGASDLTIEKKMSDAMADSAKSLGAAASNALKLLDGFEGDSRASAAKARELAKSMRAQSETLMKSVSDERAGALRSAYDAAANDLGSVSASGTLATMALCDELRLKISELRGLGSQGRTLLAMNGDKAAGLAEIKAQAEAAITALKEKATAAADQFANSAEDPALAPTKAFVDEIKKMADGLTVEKLMVPPALEKPKPAGGSSGRSMAGGDAAETGESLESIIARINAAGADMEASTKVTLGLLDDTTPRARAMKAVLEPSIKAMLPMMAAMAEKFGTESLKALQGGGAGGMGGMGGMTLGALTEKSNDGKTAVYEGPDGTKLTFIKTSSGWKVDSSALLPPEAAAQIEQAGPMMAMMAGPMKKAAEAVAAKIRSGEIATPDAVMQAFQQEMMQSMGSMGGGGGGRRGGARNN